MSFPLRRSTLVRSLAVLTVLLAGCAAADVDGAADGDEAASALGAKKKQARKREKKAPPPPATSSPNRTGPVKLGAAFQLQYLSSDPSYGPELLSHGYETVTPEWEQYMEHVETARGRFDFSKTDAMLSYAEAHGLELRGHVLVWGMQLPDWVKRPSTPWTAKTLTAVMDEWITTVMTRYRGRIAQWDVVNEPLNDDGTYKCTREDNIWCAVIGPGYVEHALRTARAADPSARLLINEYSTEWIWPKSNALYAIAQDFVARGVPLDAIGFQIHSDTRWPVDEAQLGQNFARFGALGLRTEITELDVGTAHFVGTEAERLATQAAIYGAAARACQNAPTCWELTTWGFTDRYNWLGPDTRPLPFDASYAPKPAWTAITSAVGHGTP